MSQETNEKFFQFMKELTCPCDELQQAGALPGGIRFSTTLNLCDYENVAQFTENQKGDSHLEHDDNSDD